MNNAYLIIAARGHGIRDPAFEGGQNLGLRSLVRGFDFL